LLHVHNHNLFEESISHHELLASSADVSVSVVHSQGRVSSLVDLDRHEVTQLDISLNLSRSSNSWVVGSVENIVPLVSDFKDHY
jgi:phage-related protein